MAPKSTKSAPKAAKPAPKEEDVEMDIIKEIDEKDFQVKPRNSKCKGHKLHGLIVCDLGNAWGIRSSGEFPLVFHCDDERIMEAYGDLENDKETLCKNSPLSVTDLPVDEDELYNARLATEGQKSAPAAGAAGASKAKKATKPAKPAQKAAPKAATAKPAVKAAKPAKASKKPAAGKKSSKK